MLHIKRPPFTINVFVPDGDSDGLRIVGKSNWTGTGVVFKRTNFIEADKRDEVKRTGVYLLVGQTDESTLPTIYIGEGDPVRYRLKQHYNEKNFWDWGAFFVTKDNSLNKAHVKHLESRLLQLAKEAKQCNLDNTGGSNPPTLTESVKADVENYLHDMLSIFPLLGLNLFDKTETLENETRVVLHLKAKGVKAKGYEGVKGFVVMKDSQAVLNETKTIPKFISNLRKDFFQQEILINKEQHCVFTQNQVFTSPSAAAATIVGHSQNGREIWKTSQGKTLKQLQEEMTDSSN